jgi:hypothetical protein
LTTASFSIGCRQGRPANARLFWVRSAFALTIFLLLEALGGCSFAEDVMMKEAPEEDSTREINRDEWRERVAEAKRRARQFVLEHRGRSTLDTPSMADQEQIASERVLNDGSLEPGDIVSTNKGLFVFKGRSDQERRESDFIALPSR